MSTGATPRNISDIPGWFRQLDADLFTYFLTAGDRAGGGDLVELGTFKGKSAAHMGAYLTHGETFTVCDLFGTEAGDDSNARENRSSYKTLDRAAFEENYRAVRGDLPTIVQGPSSTIIDRVTAGSARFVHIDASHLYEHVVTDIDSADKMLKAGGIVVFDDFRSEHTPGVAAAVWAAVAQRRVAPICITAKKMYAVFGDATAHRDQLASWLGTQQHLRWETQVVAGGELLRIWTPAETRRKKRASSPQPPKPPVPALPRRVAHRIRRMIGDR
jgi:predicted O-methyltransferase YrrM